MKRMGRAVGMLGFILGLGLVQPLALQAAEHGGASMAPGKEHGGTAATPSKEHGGAPVAADEAALLREAADALRKGESRPDLASQLEQLAEGKKAQ